MKLGYVAGVHALHLSVWVVDKAMISIMYPVHTNICCRIAMLHKTHRQYISSKML